MHASASTTVFIFSFIALCLVGAAYLYRLAYRIQAKHTSDKNIKKEYRSWLIAFSIPLVFLVGFAGARFLTSKTVLAIIFALIWTAVAVGIGIVLLRPSKK
jgi:cell division protein FtsW (lipid II flippase)